MRHHYFSILFIDLKYISICFIQIFYGNLLLIFLDLQSSSVIMSIPDLNFVVSEDTPIVNEECGGLHNHLLEENNIEIEPEIGMVFDSAENAYTFYNSYARRVGFSVRIFRTNKNKVDSKVIQRQVLVCSCEGFYKKVKTPQKKRDETRCDCKASFAFKRVPNNKYQVIGFEPVHSHDLAPLEHVGYLRSQRKIEFTQAELMTTMHASGLKQGQIFSYMCEEAAGIQNLNFTKSDCNNFLQRRRAEFFKKGDAECLLEYFKQKKEENKHFFYSFRTYEDGEICGVFFCDAKSRRDYGLFGDAICFDTTFRTNKYDMLCAPIVGINHHGQTSLFGCGLLDGETYDAITWLFTTFFEVMGGQKPRSIFTDQSAAISSVVDELLPQSHHGLCLWHLCQNAAKHLGSNGYKTFSSQFKSCIYDPETVEEFESMNLSHAMESVNELYILTA
ncbi:unnamed protein product [Cuscuta epithymum]|uniref:Protein FAR1-RELATED SEQUENCE n=1 Tax=Cuscuta epithymum TaxID=186058 RepID=A0AAV0CYA7_9ASTE|nr:unnamed protein product [Cuscuta epithymum]